MIYVSMGSGRDGNQMFHYAVARYVQLKNGDSDLVLDYKSLYDIDNMEEGYVEVLTNYKTVPYRHYNEKISVFKNHANFVQRVIGYLKSKYISKFEGMSRQVIEDKNRVGQKTCSMFGLYYIGDGITKIYVRKRHGNSLIFGDCETPVIYEIQDILQKELEPQKDILPENINLYNDIINSESVCVHVRRGDFWNETNKKIYGICNEKYYLDAQEKMDLKLKGIKNVKYFVFSDDIAWCKEHLRLHDMNFVVQDNMPTYEVTRLMYSCKHFIISNSTFSWWGQFLSKNKNKIVVSPSRWHNDGCGAVLIDRKKWILIDV